MTVDKTRCKKLKGSRLQGMFKFKQSNYGANDGKKPPTNTGVSLSPLEKIETVETQTARPP
jgi:hypothetical protein